MIIIDSTRFWQRLSAACLTSGQLTTTQVLGFAAAAILACGPMPAVAQVIDPYRNPDGLPNGSPLGNGSDSQSREPAQARPVDRPAPSPIIEAVDISGKAPQRTLSGGQGPQTPDPRLKPLTQSEFEKYVQSRVGRTLPRFGADLLLPGNRDYAVPATTTIPASYALNVGDVVAISLNGSIDGSVQVEVNTEGKIFLPKVGPVSVIGVRYADLKQVISRAIGTQYRGYSVTVGISSLRGVRVYVTGFANNPGAYTVNSLSTLLNATLAAGGPSSGGSLRSVKLYRRGQEVADFDLYDLLLRGDRSGDAILQNEDVLFIPPLGEQIAITGSVNVEAVFEIKSGETIASAIAHAGGTNVLADVTRAMLYRAGNLEKMSGQEISLIDQALFAVKGGDIIQLLTTGSLRRPIGLQTVVVRIEGEVNKPGNYIVPPNTDMAQIVALAGGYTSQAFVYGTKVERVSIKTQQQESYKEAIKQLEFSLLSAPLTSGRLDNSNRDIELSSARALLDQMRQAEPDGRLVLDIDPSATTLPGGLIMETNDRISIPPRPATIGVYGAVYRPASFALNPSRLVKVRDYIDRAGGELRAADRAGIFVVRASGDVISKRRGALDAIVLPGDVVFVPVKSQSTSLLAKIREVSQVIFQLGIGAAAFVTLAR